MPLSVVQLTDGAFGALARSFHSADALQYQFLVVTCGANQWDGLLQVVLRPSGTAGKQQIGAAHKH